MVRPIFILLCHTTILAFFTSCHSQPKAPPPQNKLPANIQIPSFDATTRTIHVFVALCDNKYQGIVPVPAAIGNGQHPGSNLYWGCAFGIRTFFKASKDWRLLQVRKPDTLKLERLVFKHATQNIYLVADAYNGRYIKQCTIDFLEGLAGRQKDTLQINGKAVGTGGHASLLAYIGHDGLMDFELPATYTNTDGNTRDCLILACYSKSYFAPHVKTTQARPLLWTTGLMCPEAYSLHAALVGYVAQETPAQMQARAAAAYARYQHCSVKAASRLLVEGW